MASKGQFTNLRVRLERHIETCPATGCWLFTGKLDKDGYGNMHNRSGGGDYKAHRVAWLEYRGEIPSALDVAHHCDVRCCVNPEHLYIATRSQNIADRTARKREPRGERHCFAKLNDAAVMEIRKSGLSVTELTARFGVSRAAVYRARNAETWAHIQC